MAKPSLEDFVGEVAAVVIQTLGDRTWFTSPCLDDVHLFYPDKMSKAIDHAVRQTLDRKGETF